MKKCLICLMLLVQLAAIVPAYADWRAEDFVFPEGTETVDIRESEEMRKKAKEADFVFVPLMYYGAYEQINATIKEKAQLEAYENLLKFGTGSAGLKVYPESFANHGDVYSLAICANGKMPVGRPSQVYYPMTFDVLTGEEIPFEALFSDADGAMAYMEAKLEEREEALSTHLENRSLFPVPFDRYTIDVNGNLTIWYERDQLSFLSGFSGAVNFRFSELEPYYDLSEGSYISKTQEEKTEVGFMNGLGDRNCIGWDMEDVLYFFRSTIDSEYYPGGACYEVEDAKLYGTLLLTDDSEEMVLGLLSSNLDDNGIITGKTTLDEAKVLLGEGLSLQIDETIAQEYRVCAGECLVYKKTANINNEDVELAYTLYADKDGIIQYLKLMIEN